MLVKDEVKEKSVIKFDFDALTVSNTKKIFEQDKKIKEQDKKIKEQDKKIEDIYKYAKNTTSEKVNEYINCKNVCSKIYNYSTYFEDEDDRFIINIKPRIFDVECKKILVINNIIDNIIEKFKQISDSEDIREQVRIVSLIIQDINKLLKKIAKNEDNLYKRRICLNTRIVLKTNYCISLFNDQQINTFITCFQTLKNQNVDKKTFTDIDKMFYNCRLI